MRTLRFITMLLIIVLFICSCGNSNVELSQESVPPEDDNVIIHEEPEAKEEVKVENVLGVILCEADNDSESIQKYCDELEIEVSSFDRVETRSCQGKDECLSLLENCIDSGCNEIVIAGTTECYDSLNLFLQNHNDTIVHFFEIIPQFTINKHLTFFNSGRAWVSFKDRNNDSFWALIDENGNTKIVAKRTGDYGFCLNGGDSAYLYQNDLNNNGTSLFTPNDSILLVDADGKEIINLQPDEYVKSYEAIAYSGDTLAIKKNVSSFSENGDYLFFVSADGTIYDEEIDITGMELDRLKQFSLDEDHLILGDLYYLDLEKHSLKRFPGINGDRDQLRFVIPPYEGVCLAYYTDFYNGGHCFGVSVDSINEIADIGTTDTLSTYLNTLTDVSGWGGPDLKEANEGLYYPGYNHTFYYYDGTIATELPQFPEGVANAGFGAFSGGYAPMRLVGADKCLYVTMFDKNGQLLYEPIKCDSDLKYFEGYFYIDDASYITPEGKIVEDSGDDVVRDFVGINENVALRQIGSMESELLYKNGYGFFKKEDGIHVKKWDGSEEFSQITIGSETVYFDDAKPYWYEQIEEEQPISEETNISEDLQATDNDLLQEESQKTPISSPKTYTTMNNFSIKGKWKSVGEYGFGQAQPGAIIVFDGNNCNLFSPRDTYALTKGQTDYTLDCTSSFTADTVSFTVKIIDKNNIDLCRGEYITELKRVE